MEEANYLTKFASKVTIVHRRDEFRASKIMQDRVLNNPKIDIMWNSAVDDMVGEVSEGGLKSVKIKNILSDEVNEVKCDGIFIAIGHQPNSKIFSNLLQLNSHGYIITKDSTTATSVPGIFAAGDVQDAVYRQAVTAAGSGCMAAIDAERYLETLH